MQDMTFYKAGSLKMKPLNACILYVTQTFFIWLAFKFCVLKLTVLLLFLSCKYVMLMKDFSKLHVFHFSMLCYFI